MRWWQFDLSAYVIRLLECTGLASNVCRIPIENIQARLVRRTKLEPVVPRVEVADERLS